MGWYINQQGNRLSNGELTYCSKYQLTNYGKNISVEFYLIKENDFEEKDKKKLAEYFLPETGTESWWDFARYFARKTLEDLKDALSEKKQVSGEKTTSFVFPGWVYLEKLPPQKKKKVLGPFYGVGDLK